MEEEVIVVVEDEEEEGMEAGWVELLSFFGASASSVLERLLAEVKIFFTSSNFCFFCTASFSRRASFLV